MLLLPLLCNHIDVTLSLTSYVHSFPNPTILHSSHLKRWPSPGKTPTLEKPDCLPVWCLRSIARAVHTADSCHILVFSSSLQPSWDCLVPHPPSSFSLPTCAWLQLASSIWNTPCLLSGLVNCLFGFHSSVESLPAGSLQTPLLPAAHPALHFSVLRAPPLP